MSTVLAPYCDETLTAASGREAIALIARDRQIDLVLCDVVMGDGDGFTLLEELAAMGDPAPRVVMVTAYPRERAAKRALALGARAYLSKPTTMRRILTAVGLSDLNERAERHTRWRCAGRAYLVEEGHEGEAFVAWDVYNLGATGAFLETKGPLPIGAELELLLVVCGRKAGVKARVVRVQEPSWINVGGVGVKFAGGSDDLEALLAGAIENAEPVDEPLS